MKMLTLRDLLRKRMRRESGWRSTRREMIRSRVELIRTRWLRSLRRTPSRWKIVIKVWWVRTRAVVHSRRKLMTRRTLIRSVRIKTYRRWRAWRSGGMGVVRWRTWGRWSSTWSSTSLGSKWTTSCRHTSTRWVPSSTLLKNANYSYWLTQTRPPVFWKKKNNFYRRQSVHIPGMRLACQGQRRVRLFDYWGWPQTADYPHCWGHFPSCFVEGQTWTTSDSTRVLLSQTLVAPALSYTKTISTQIVSFLFQV